MSKRASLFDSGDVPPNYVQVAPTNRRAEHLQYSLRRVLNLGDRLVDDLDLADAIVREGLHGGDRCLCRAVAVGGIPSTLKL